MGPPQRRPQFKFAGRRGPAKERGDRGLQTAPVPQQATVVLKVKRGERQFWLPFERFASEKPTKRDGAGYALLCAWSQPACRAELQNVSGGFLPMKGNEKVIAELNGALAAELTSIVQCMVRRRQIFSTSRCGPDLVSYEPRRCNRPRLSDRMSCLSLLTHEEPLHVEFSRSRNLGFLRTSCSLCVDSHFRSGPVVSF